MSFVLTSPLTGSVQTGFTAPTFTLVADTAPTTNGKQYQVSALGGTQGTAKANTLDAPFTLSFFRPASLKVITKEIGSAFGMVPNNPKNEWKCITRHATPINSLGGSSMIEIQTVIRVPVGGLSLTLGEDALKSAMSAHAGMINQTPAQIVDTVINGSL